MDTNKIPLFPDFVDLDVSHKDFIEDFVAKYPPDSNYNFVCLYSYGIGYIKLSLLNDNLVTIAPDVLDEKINVSFIGSNKIEDTIKTLLDYSEKEFGIDHLKLIPECSINQVSNFKFFVDDENSDYILSVERMYTFEGKSLRGKRNLLNRFNKEYGADILSLNFKNPRTKRQVLKLFGVWLSNKNTEENCFIERDAVNELMNSPVALGESIGVYVDGILIAFVIYEIKGEYCLLHFWKYDITHIGIAAFTLQALAEKALDKGCKYINIEQDLGLKGLRESKKQLCPVNMFKTYIIKK